MASPRTTVTRTWCSDAGRRMKSSPWWKRSWRVTRPGPRPAPLSALAWRASHGPAPAMPSVLRVSSLAVLALVGCERTALPGQAVVDFRHTREPGGTPVASWTGDRVTAEELRRHLEEMTPASRERYQTLEQKREYVEGLARFELLVREALARGLQDDPEVVAGTKRALVSRLMRTELDAAAPPVSEA